jgi:ferredoxin
MTHVVTENCVNCKHTDCVSVCPVDCFYEGENFLVINPNECIDCGVCIPECPVDAIVEDTDKSAANLQFWIDFNARLSKQWKVITKRKDPMPDAEFWKDKTDKAKLVKE